MISDKDIASALAIVKKINIALTEALDLTIEMSSAIKSNDQVVMRMFLSMRQEQINIINEYESVLTKQCSSMDEADSKTMSDILFAKKCDIPGANDLFEQTSKNKMILSRILAADRSLNIKVGGEKSFYFNTD